MVELPPVFCMMSQTTADLSNKHMHDPTYTTKAHCLKPLDKEMDEWNLLPSNETKLTKLAATPESTAAPDAIVPGHTTPKLTKLATAPKCTSTPTATMLAPTMPKPLPQPLDWPSSKPLEDPMGYVNVYVDDFIGLVQGPKNRC
jgi:hypothetical protein